MDRKNLTPLRLASLWCALLSISLGCGANESSPVSVKGIVKSKSGRPCNKALVVFHPTDKERVNDPKPVATTDEEGRFALTTFRQSDGARPGEYAVTVVWPGQDSRGEKISLTGEGGSSGADRLKGKYGNPSKPLLRASIPREAVDDLLLEVD